MNETMRMTLLQCPACSGIMYPNQKSSRYQCAFCGHTSPFSKMIYSHGPITFRHKPVQRVDGYIKLGHVEIMSPPTHHDDGVLSWGWRRCSAEEKLSFWDRTTAKAFAALFQMTFTCPRCGGEISGQSNQSIFECKSCGNKLGAAEALQPGKYRKELVMGVGAESIPCRAIPFHLSPEEARSRALGLVRQYPAEFAGQDMERRIKETMTAVYIPVSLADLSLKVRLQSSKGSCLAYQETINWACPDTTLYDIYLLDRLEPWDFGAVAAFDPAFMEGDVRVAAIANNASRVHVIENLLPSRIREDAALAFGIKDIEILSIGSDFRRHDGGNLLLPVYYVDCRPEDSERSLQVKIAVNGQTGGTAALLLGRSSERYLVKAPPPGKRSAETTLRTPMLPVRPVKSPFLHEILPPEKALTPRRWWNLWGLLD